MKIGFAVERYDEGVGMANIAFNLAKELSDDHETYILTLDYYLSESFRKLTEDEGIEVHTFDFGSGLKARLRSRRYAKEIDSMNFDVLSSHGFVMSLTCALSDTPAVSTYHAHTLIWEEYRNHPVRIPLWVLEQAPSIYLSEDMVSISKYAKRQLRKVYRKDSEVIYNGIDLDTYSQDVDKDKFLEKHDIDPDQKILGTLCMLRDYKNIDLALEALGDVEEDYVYLIGGTGPRKELLEEKVEKYEVNAKFLGFIDEEELPAYYASLDLFLFPSLWEGFGVPILESLACGTPSVALDQKGPKEIIEDGESGFLISEKPEEWTRTIENFLSSSDKMSEKARERAEDFSWEKSADQYLEKFKEVAK